MTENIPPTTIPFILKSNFDEPRQRSDVMERYAWKAKLKEGKRAEYQRRHDEIWPEMKELLKSAGLCNYSIWNVGDDLFGYYECEKGIAFATEVQAKSPIVERWNQYMKDVMEMELDPETGAQPHLTEMFYLK